LLSVARSVPKEVVRSTNAGSFVGRKRGASLARLIGKVSSLGEGKRLEVMVRMHDGSATQTWLVDALEYARANEQTRVVRYLEAVIDDAVFEMEMAARHS
jgi:hypothetical protein